MPGAYKKERETGVWLRLNGFEQQREWHFRLTVVSQISEAVGFGWFEVLTDNAGDWLARKDFFSTSLLKKEAENALCNVSKSLNKNYIQLNRWFSL